MSKIIVIDSSSEELLVALINDEEKNIYKSVSLLKKHNSVLLPEIDTLLSEGHLEPSDLDAVACVVGPGSFTGIRLSVTTANALASGLNIPLIAVNALEVMAYDVAGRIMSVIDARHGNYYGGIYNNGEEIELNNYTEEELKAFDGEVLSRDDSFGDKLLAKVQGKYAKKDFVKLAVPLYLKLSQAERELNERS